MTCSISSGLWTGSSTCNNRSSNDILATPVGLAIDSGNILCSEELQGADPPGARNQPCDGAHRKPPRAQGIRSSTSRQVIAAHEHRRGTPTQGGVPGVEEASAPPTSSRRRPPTAVLVPGHPGRNCPTLMTTSTSSVQSPRGDSTEQSLCTAVPAHGDANRSDGPITRNGILLGRDARRMNPSLIGERRARRLSSAEPHPSRREGCDANFTTIRPLTARSPSPSMSWIPTLRQQRRSGAVHFSHTFAAASVSGERIAMEVLRLEQRRSAAMTRRIRRLLIGVCAALLCYPAAAQRLLALDLPPTTDLQAEFRPDCSSVPTVERNPRFLRSATTNGTFHLYLDPSTIGLDQYGKSFNYTFYVNAGTTWFKCETAVNTRGAFVDRFERVHFVITHDNVADDGAIDLPMHNIAKGDFLDITTASSPVRVNLSRAPSVDLQLHNLLPDTSLVVSTTLQTRAANADNWTGLGTTKVAGDTIRIRPGETTTMHVPLQPLKWPALLATLASVKPDGLHDKLGFELAYASDLGGANRTRTFEVGVRFVPSIINLLLALIAGSLLGTLTTQFLPNMWAGWRAARFRAGKALLFSIIAELFAMLMVALGSKFVIIQFDLDPWQFLPTLFIGLIVSGGKDILKYLELSRSAPQQMPPSITP